MSTIKANTVQPKDAATDLTLGASGDTVTLPGNDLRVNTVKDKGGNTLWTSDGSGTLSSVNSGLKGGGPILIQSQTFAAQTAVNFTTGIDSTYDKYMFVIININPSAEPTELKFKVSTNGGSSYAGPFTTTFFLANNNPSGGEGLSYQTSYDEAAGTNQALFRSLGSGASESCSGILHLFAPSSTTYIKQFYSTIQGRNYDPQSYECFVGGYVDTTSAIDAVQFYISSGTFDGTITLYGVG